MFSLVKAMHEKFGIAYTGSPKNLSIDEFHFRIKAFNEEIQEYKDAYVKGDLEGQLDALIDLMVFALGACEKHGFNNVEKAFERVMRANMQKALVESASESKRGHKADLKKPAGWRAPYLKDLITNFPHKGLIVLEGPDGCGKTTLAKFIQRKYHAHIIHSSWSPDLDKRMNEYMLETLEQAIEISENQLVVLDRHWLSELVYADVYRGGTSLKRNLHSAIHQGLVNAGAKIILCLPYNLDKINECFNDLRQSREEMYTSIVDVVNAYATLWDSTKPIYQFKANLPYLDRLAYQGGLKNPYLYVDNLVHTNEPVVRYDWMQDGEDMDKFIINNHIINIQ